MSWAQHQWGTVEARASDTQRAGCQSREVPMASLMLCVPISAPVWSSEKKEYCNGRLSKEIKKICLHKVIKSTSGDLFYFQRWKPWLRGLSTIPSHGVFIYHVGCSGWRVNREKETMAKPQAPFHTLSRSRMMKGPLQLIQTSLKKIREPGGGENTYRISQLISSIKSSGFCSMVRSPPPSPPTLLYSPHFLPWEYVRGIELKRGFQLIKWNVCNDTVWQHHPEQMRQLRDHMNRWQDPEADHRKWFMERGGIWVHFVLNGKSLKWTEIKADRKHPGF